MVRIVVLGLMVIFFLDSCKQQRVVTQQPVKDVVMTLDTLDATPEYFITSSGDTLLTLDEEVSLEMYRIIKDTLTIIGVGDIMMGTNFPSVGYLPPNGGRFLLSEVADTLGQADVTFGNLEGVILDEGGEQKNCKNPKVCYLFRSPESYVQHLVDAGFDMVSLANNHAGDFGQTGRKNTMRTLDSLKIKYAGLLSAPTATLMVDGMTYGLVAFSPNKGTVSIHNEERAIELVQGLDSLVDVVIVSFHAGAEGAKHQNVTRKTETFYGENRGNVYDFSRKMIDAGGDVVFGHGPHVTRAMDVYKNRFISYSLGNFCTYGRFNLRGVNGVAPIVKIKTDAEGKFIEGQIFPIQQVGAGIPEFDREKSAISLIQELTKKDFPESNLKIEDSGRITYLEN